MLNTEDIKDLVNGGEGYNVDFKRNVPSKVRELTEEVCSFLNAAGGYLLIGVNDNNEIVGAEIDDNQAHILSYCHAFATLSITADSELKTVSILLGHSSMAIPLSMPM